MTAKWISICAFDANRQGIDKPETLLEYTSPKEGRAAGNAVLAKYPDVSAVWVRAINNGHMRTITMIERDLR